MYRTIDTSTWDDERVMKLDRVGKLLFVYLITNRNSHVSGIYYLPTVLIEHDLGIKNTVLDTLWDTLSRLELCWRDKKTEVVFVKKMLMYQGRGEKNLRAAANQLNGLHKSFLINKFIEFYPKVKPFIKDTLSDTLSNTPSRVGIQEQEQEQEQEQDMEGASRRPKPSRKVPADFQVTEEMQSWTKQEFPALDVAAQTELFRDHEFDKAKTDWPAAWRNWMRKAAEWQSASSKGKTGEKTFHEQLFGH